MLSKKYETEVTELNPPRVHELDLSKLDITELQCSELYNAVSTTNGITILTFGASWCGPCRMMNMTLQDILDEHLVCGKFEDNDYTIYAINVDKCMDITKAMKIVSIPTQLVFKDGGYIGSMIGAQSASGLLSAIKDMIRDIDTDKIKSVT